jgi:hypothetical protein
MASYTRLYADKHGESHFDDIEIAVTLTDYAPPAPPLELSSTTTATQFGFMNAPAPVGRAIGTPPQRGISSLF